MTLLAYITALLLLILAGCVVVGSGLYLADRCCPAIALVLVSALVALIVVDVRRWLRWRSLEEDRADD